MKALIDWLAAVAGKERAVEERRSGFVLVDKTPPAPVTEPHEPPAPPPISDEELYAKHPGQLPIRQASRSYSNKSPLVALLYRLMRDDVTPGVMEGAVQAALSHGDQPVQFTNGWLAQYAADIVERLTDDEDDEPHDKDVLSWVREEVWDFFEHWEQDDDHDIELAISKLIWIRQLLESKPVEEEPPEKYPLR